MVTAAPLPYLLIILKVIQLEKISFSYMKNLNTVLKTLTADDMYSLLNRDTLTQTIQMQLSQKQKPFS